MDKRSQRLQKLTIDEQTFDVWVVEAPFREGVELSCEVEGELIRVSDRGLGEHEAFRLLEASIREKLQKA